MSAINDHAEPSPGQQTAPQATQVEEEEEEEEEEKASDSSTSPEAIEDENDSDNAEDFSIDLSIHFKPLVDRIASFSKSAFPASTATPSPPSIPTFQSIWRSRFNDLIEDLAGDSSIPEFITSPPIPNFWINVFLAQTEPSCPCCLPSGSEAKAVIALNNPDGVTKRDLVRAVGGYLYGDGSGRNGLPEIQHPDTEEVSRKAVVVDRFDSMVSGKDEYGVPKLCIGWRERTREVFHVC